MDKHPRPDLDATNTTLRRKFIGNLKAGCERSEVLNFLEPLETIATFVWAFILRVWTGKGLCNVLTSQSSWRLWWHWWEAWRSGGSWWRSKTRSTYGRKFCRNLAASCTWGKSVNVNEPLDAIAARVISTSANSPRFQHIITRQRRRGRRGRGSAKSSTRPTHVRKLIGNLLASCNFKNMVRRDDSLEQPSNSNSA